MVVVAAARVRVAVETTLSIFSPRCPAHMAKLRQSIKMFALQVVGLSAELAEEREESARAQLETTKLGVLLREKERLLADAGALLGAAEKYCDEARCARVYFFVWGGGGVVSWCSSITYSKVGESGLIPQSTCLSQGASRSP